MFCPHFYSLDSFYDFMFFHAFKEKNLLLGGNSFSSNVSPILEERKTKNNEIASLKVYPELWFRREADIIHRCFLILQ